MFRGICLLVVQIFIDIKLLYGGLFLNFILNLWGFLALDKFKLVLSEWIIRGEQPFSF